MPATPRFTILQVQRAALDIVDRDGLPSLTMRSLAKALGTGPMTIYNYCRDREELESMVVEAIMATVRLPAGDGPDWREDARRVLQQLWGAVADHPRAIPLILTRRTSHGATLRIAEALLQALARSGMSPFDLLIAFRTLNSLVIGLAQAKVAAFGDPGDPQGSHATAVQALPGEDYPRLREIAAVAATLDPDAEFAAGVDRVLARLPG